MGQSLDVVWWLVFESTGEKRNLAEVRAWVLRYRNSVTGAAGGDWAGSVGRCGRSGS